MNRGRDFTLSSYINTSMIECVLWTEAYLCLYACDLQAHKIDPSNHYLRLKVCVEDRMLFYVPSSEEDVSDLVRGIPKHGRDLLLFL